MPRKPKPPFDADSDRTTKPRDRKKAKAAVAKAEIESFGYGDFVDLPASHATEWRAFEDKKSGDGVARSGPPPQAVALASAPLFPGSVKWSDENLVAVAAGHTVTIFSPVSLSGPRGFISISPSSIFDIGRVKHEDLNASVLLPFTLQRDNRVHIRCLDWSPAGAASNGGCLLAVCTTDHRVKLYRAPCKEYQSEWIEVADLSQRMHEYCVENNFQETEQSTLIVPLKVRSCMEVKDKKMEKFKNRKRAKKKDMTLSSIKPDFSAIEDSAWVDEHKRKVHLCISPEPINAVSERSLKLLEQMAVEVLKEDAGSRYWARAVLVKLMEEKALVQYDASFTESVKEEFVPFFVESPVVSSREGGDDHVDLDALLLSGCDPQLKLSFRPGIRPILETENDGENFDFLVGDLVEAWINGRWQEGRLLKIDGGKKVVDFCGHLGQVILETTRLRPSPEWNGENWLHFKVESGTTCTRPVMGEAVLDANGIEALSSDCRGQCIDSKPFEHIPRYSSDQYVMGLPALMGKASSLKCNILTDPQSLMVQKLYEVEQSQHIATTQYVERSYLMAAIALSWSPKCRVVCSGGSESWDRYREYFFLAVGTKSGRAAFWRIQSPHVFSIEEIPPIGETTFLGFFTAHDSWLTAVDWAISQSKAAFDVGLSEESLLLATGSYDGSVKLWSAPLCILAHVPSSSHLPWVLIKQVVQIDSVPVTTLSLRECIEIPKCVLLAIGKASGAVIASELDLFNSSLRTASQPRAHEQLVTGVSWASDGHHLYSCGQDNSLEGWLFDGYQLVSVISSDCSGLQSSVAQTTTTDIPFSAVDSIYGVALSPCSFSLAMVCGIASEATDPMYQSRSQKGVLQILWVGGHGEGNSLSNSAVEANRDPSSNPFQNLELKITSALKLLEARKQFLVLWDVVAQWSYAANLNFTSFFDLMLSKWLGNQAEMACFEWGTKTLTSFLSKASCRQLQILVILYRRVLFLKIKAEVLSALSGKNPDALSGLDQLKSELSPQEHVWLDQFCHIEHELRQRLFSLIISSVLCHLSVHKRSAQRRPSFQNGTLPAALRMSSWILGNISDSSHPVIEEATQFFNYWASSSTSSTEFLYEECPLCDQPVRFEFLEGAKCVGSGSAFKSAHISPRCAVSLQICPLKPLWVCHCCARRAMQPAPAAFFTLQSRRHIKELSPAFLLSQISEPLCPFCGILMYRLLPEFLLTPSLV